MLAALFVAGEMVVAYARVHGPAHHPFVNPGGPSFELAALYFVPMLALLLAGPGAYSLDAWLLERHTVRETPAAEVARRRGFA